MFMVKKSQAQNISVRAEKLLLSTKNNRIPNKKASHVNLDYTETYNVYL